MNGNNPVPYSSRTRVALAIARAIAAARGDRDLTSIHIALGLVREGENGALAALHHQRVPIPALRSALERGLGPPPGGTRAEEVAIELTPGERRIMEHARIAAEGEGDSHIGPEHLLLALLSDQEDTVSLLLAQHGVDAATTKASLRVVVRKHDHDSPSKQSAPPATN
jgi:ATP-dependent Clp protease ATP-binding subunit ClpA